MGIICESCGRDIDALGQDNMSCTCEPLCEDCWNEQQSHADAIPAMVAVKREEKAGDAATLRLVARFDSREEYLAWLKSERCGE